MGRLHLLQRTVLEQRDLIVRHNEHLLNEQRVAKAVFDKVAHSGCLNASNVRYLQSPLALFNGDLLLAAYKPSGGMHVLLGDRRDAAGRGVLRDDRQGLSDGRHPPRDERQAEAHPAGRRVLLRHLAQPELPARTGGGLERRLAGRLPAARRQRRAGRPGVPPPAAGNPRTGGVQRPLRNLSAGYRRSDIPVFRRGPRGQQQGWRDVRRGAAAPAVRAQSPAVRAVRRDPAQPGAVPRRGAGRREHARSAAAAG